MDTRIRTIHSRSHAGSGRRTARPLARGGAAQPSRSRRAWPCASFQSVRPLDMRPQTTDDAADGEVKFNALAVICHVSVPHAHQFGNSIPFRQDRVNIASFGVCPQGFPRGCFHTRDCLKKHSVRVGYAEFTSRTRLSDHDI